MKTGELAKRLFQSPSNIRTWADQYGKYLSPQGRGAASGSARNFNPDDQIVMATVAHLRQLGRSHDEILAELEEGWRVDEIPGEPTPAKQREIDDKALVPAGQLRVIQEQVNFLQEERARLLEMVAKERGRTDQHVEEIRRLERELGRAQGRIEELEKRQNGQRPRWPWQRNEP